MLLLLQMLLQLYKEGLHYDWFHDEFPEDFQNGLFTKTTRDGCFHNFNLTTLVTL